MQKLFLIEMEAAVFNSFETFDQSWERFQTLYNEGKTTGENQSEAMIHYTQMSITRIKRGLSHYQITEELKQAVKNTKALNWLLITEAWCGDASNTTPIMALAAALNPHIQLRVMVRDEHPEIMAHYLTNGSKSIPILVMMDKDFNELAKWGPRPKECQEMVLEAKSKGELPIADLMTMIQKWYIADATQSTQREIALALTNP